MGGCRFRGDGSLEGSGRVPRPFAEFCTALLELCAVVKAVDTHNGVNLSEYACL